MPGKQISSMLQWVVKVQSTVKASGWFIWAVEQEEWP
jgi:hypothetical protein